MALKKNIRYRGVILIVYCLIIFILLTYYILTYKKSSTEYKSLPKKDFPLSFMYGGATILINFFERIISKKKPSKKDILQMKRLSSLYVGIKPEKLLSLYKAKCISISSALLFMICTLCLIIELFNSGKQYVSELDVPDALESSKVYDLVAEIDNETTEISISVDSKPISLEDALEYFDSKRDAIEMKMLGENASTEEIKTDLSFFNSYEDISIIFEPENPLIIDSSGKLLIENISEDGVFTSVYATLSYKGQSAMVSFPLFIKCDNRTGLVDEIYEYMSENNNGNDSISLPDNIAGKKIRFYIADTTYTSVFF